MKGNKVLMVGNEAIAMAAISAGCRFYAGYPITPQNELVEYMSKHMLEAGGTFIQSESELAAINMVFGASAAGARAMTSSSSPGISLKQEGISYLAACELPAVIVNISRGGPGLGNIAPSQSDYFQATKGGGHGDYHQIVLGPASVQEAIELTHHAFYLADKYRTPVMLLGDGILGQMMEPVDAGINEKLKNDMNLKIKDKPWVLTGCKGRKPRIIRSLLLGEGELEALNRKLQGKYERIKATEVRCETLNIDDADLILVAFGTTSRFCRAVVLKMRKENVKIGLIRPVTGQMVEDVRLTVQGKARVKFYGRTGGEIPTEEDILKEVRHLLKEEGVYKS